MLTRYLSPVFATALIAALATIAVIPAAAAKDVRALKAQASVRVAEEQPGSQADQQACTPDVFRLCGQYIPDVDGIVGCLKAQRPNLSPACKAVFHAPVR